MLQTEEQTNSKQDSSTLSQNIKQELSSCWDGRPFDHNRHGPKV